MGIKKVLSFLIASIFFLANPAFAMAATLSLSPSSGTFNSGCNYSVDIILDTGGVATDGTDAVLNYDQSKITVTSITTGTIYSDYPQATYPNGTISISGIDSSQGQSYTGKGTFATINFTVAQTISSAPMVINFQFDPNTTTNSNVVQAGTVNNILTQVVNGNYTLVNGNGCSSTGTTTTTSSGGTTGTGTTGAGIGGLESSGSATPLPSKLPVAGSSDATLFLALGGGALTILGVLGLALL